MGDIGRLTLCPGSPYWDASWHPKPSIHVSLINCESEVWRPKADEPNSDPGTVPGFADQLWILISSDQCSTTINDQLWSTPHRPTDGLFTRAHHRSDRTRSTMWSFCSNGFLAHMKMSNEMILVFVWMGGGEDSWNLKTAFQIGAHVHTCDVSGTMGGEMHLYLPKCPIFLPVAAKTSIYFI